MGVAEINLLHETMQSIKITNTLKKTKKKNEEEETTTTSPKILPGYGLHFVAVSGRQKKKKTPSSRKNSNVKLRQKAENASLYKTNS